jgi:hypothetical protein
LSRSIETQRPRTAPAGSGDANLASTVRRAAGGHCRGNRGCVVSGRDVATLLSLTHSLTHPPTHSLTHPLTHHSLLGGRALTFCARQVALLTGSVAAACQSVTAVGADAYDGTTGKATGFELRVAGTGCPGAVTRCVASYDVGAFSRARGIDGTCILRAVSSWTTRWHRDPTRRPAMLDCAMCPPSRSECGTCGYSTMSQEQPVPGPWRAALATAPVRRRVTVLSSGPAPHTQYHYLSTVATFGASDI